MRPIVEATQRYRRVVAIMGSQMGKTANLLNVIGQKLDDDPAPILYVGPTKSNIDSVIEPQIQHMLRQSRSLWSKTRRGRKAQKLVKHVAGVTLRLAWAGSPTELASQPAHTVLIDEVDRMKPIPGEGDPVTLAEARTSNYPDGRIIITSTPTAGNVDTYVHPETGVEHWTTVAGDDLESQVWRFWQEGTRFEWAVPCPHCHEYFVPRFKHLSWPEGCSPRRAAREARLACPRCGALIGDEHKLQMNLAGQFLAPGQRVLEGRVVGDPPDSDVASFWASGLMSPWKSFGERAQEWLKAVASGDHERIRGVINTGFGELYRVVGDAPPWQTVQECAQPYAAGSVPAGAVYVFLSVDVQKDRLVCLVRAWGPEYESWLVHHEELWGETDQPEVWGRLDELVARRWDERELRAVAVDSGYRAEQVYTWCQRHHTIAYATKGRDAPSKLYASTLVESLPSGRRLATGVKLWTLDSGYFKGWVHDRIVWPQDQPGAWHLPHGIAEEYCRQIVAESRLRLPSGRTQWVRASRENHYLDCEALQVFLAHVEGVRHLAPTAERAAPAPGTMAPPVKPAPRTQWMNRPRSWIRR